MSLVLARDERAAFNAAEATIERGLASFIEVGEALALVRDSRLYRETHATFEDYCQKRWGLSRRHVNRTIAAAEIVTAVGPMGPIPTSERQARELVGLPPETAAAVLATAAEATDGKLTAAAIREARQATEAPWGDAPSPAPRPAEIDPLPIDTSAKNRRLADAAVAEFPDLAYYRDEAPDLEHCWRLAATLRTFGPSEQERRLETLRRSIDYDRRLRNGEAPASGTAPSPEPTPTTCPTCGQDTTSIGSAS